MEFRAGWALHSDDEPTYRLAWSQPASVTRFVVGVEQLPWFERHLTGHTGHFVAIDRSLAKGHDAVVLHDESTPAREVGDDDLAVGGAGVVAQDGRDRPWGHHYSVKLTN
jgi:hypothetical protein